MISYRGTARNENHSTSSRCKDVGLLTLICTTYGRVKRHKSHRELRYITRDGRTPAG